MRNVRWGLLVQMYMELLDKPPSYYYTPQEWSRLGMWGPLPDERNTELRGVNQDRRTDEDVSEESDT